ncbi:MAG: phosphoribosylanthranilate isomerase [Terriglobales bacterium]
MTWVKICGTTSLEDALVAVEAGANALGFVFAESPRRLTPEAARAIIAVLPATVQKVGVFVNEAAERIRDITAQAGLTAVQLHGDETPDFAGQLFPWQGTRRGCRIFKAIPVRPGFEAHAQEFTPRQNTVDALLLDSYSESARGGTGRPFDWQLASTAAPRLALRSKLILAGGLDAGSVGAAIRLLRPWGVDVVSGVESMPGRKDPDKVRAFLAAVRAADKEHTRP